MWTIYGGVAGSAHMGGEQAYKVEPDLLRSKLAASVDWQSSVLVKFIGAIGSPGTIHLYIH